jgi:hypothetical protein
MDVGNIWEPDNSFLFFSPSLFLTVIFSSVFLGAAPVYRQ